MCYFKLQMRDGVDMESTLDLFNVISVKGIGYIFVIWYSPYLIRASLLQLTSGNIRGVASLEEIFYNLSASEI